MADKSRFSVSSDYAFIFFLPGTTRLAAIFRSKYLYKGLLTLLEKHSSKTELTVWSMYSAQNYSKET